MPATPTEAVFAFGPQSTYFFEYNGKRKWYNLPYRMRNLFNEDEVVKVKKTFCVAFTGNGGWLVVYEDSQGVVKHVYDALPLALTYFLEEGRNTMDGGMQLDSLRVICGENTEFFATALSGDGERHYRWNILSPTMQIEFQRCLAQSYPSSHTIIWNVALGKDSYLIYKKSPAVVRIAVSPAFVQYFKGGTYAALDEYINSEDSIKEHLIVMNPFVVNQYFLLRPDGTASWKINAAHNDAVRALASDILEDQSVDGTTDTEVARRKRKRSAEVAVKREVKHEED